MSYGLIVSRTGHVLVETTAAPGRSSSDAALDRFQASYGAVWVPARLALTSLHLTLLPTRASAGLGSVELDLRQVAAVEIDKRPARTIGVRTAGHVVRVRVTGGAMALAQQVARASEDLQRQHRTV